MKYYLSLGSNLGNRFGALRKALFRLSREGRIIRTSSIYETRPVEMKSNTPFFLNLAVEYQCRMVPFDLLGWIRGVEKELGRTTEQGHRSSRIVDIDILFAGKRQIRSRELTIPHPRLTDRAFVLVPLADIAADFIHPVWNKTIFELLKELKSRNAEIFSGISPTDLSV
jgi:2-amino-4-hydroxy-6-hydroxymethyldihydropteridine diphosphokinase